MQSKQGKEVKRSSQRYSETSNVGCRCDQTFGPLRLPTRRDGTVVPEFTKFRASLLPDRFGVLPTELLLEIFSQLPAPSLLALSAASRGLRALITEPHFLNQVFKAAVLGGSAFWILPVRTIVGEEKRAEEIGMEWLANVRGVNSTVIEGWRSVFYSESFPYVTFVHACYESDSMRNRERFWKIVKQFDDIWRDYRVHGWQRDVFIH